MAKRAHGDEPPQNGLSTTPDGVRISVHVQPRASRTEVVGWHGEAIRIRLAAPPVDGAANEALVHYLAEALGVSRQAVRLVSGAGSRRKVLEIAGIGREETVERLGLP